MSPEFIDGGHIAQGEEILKIDPVDYELALADAESRLQQSRFELKEELGRQEVAKREWELLKVDNASQQEEELALRKPHLEAKKAAVAAAEASLKKAKVNLQRTTLVAPFNAMILERKVNIGSQSNQQAELASLVGTDAYWITVSIPVDRLRWVTIPGSQVRIESASGAVREGQVIKLLASLEEKGRMARLLVEVKDPLCRLPESTGLKPLLLGEFVKASVYGTELDSVFTIPRKALREGNVVWIATQDNKLDIRAVDVLWRDSEQVILRDSLSNGEALIISDINTPINGMDVNTGKGGPQKKPGMQKSNLTDKDIASKETKQAE
jgi:RND family efflux transporter MFP subunit